MLPLPLPVHGERLHQVFHREVRWVLPVQDGPFEQVCGEGMPQRVGRCRLGQIGVADRLLDRPLQRLVLQVAEFFKLVVA